MAPMRRDEGWPQFKPVEREGTTPRLLHTKQALTRFEADHLEHPVVPRHATAVVEPAAHRRRTRAPSPTSTCCACRRSPANYPGARGQPRRGPVRADRRSAARLHGGARRRRRYRWPGRHAPPLRQHDPQPLAGGAGAAATASVAGRPRGYQHAARPRRRPCFGDAVGTAARDDHPPRVLLAAPARRPGRGGARAPCRGLRGMRFAPGQARRDARGRSADPAADRLDDPHRRLQPSSDGPPACAPDGAVRRRRGAPGCRMSGCPCTRTARSRRRWACTTARSGPKPSPATSSAPAPTCDLDCGRSMSNWRRKRRITSR